MLAKLPLATAILVLAAPCLPAQSESVDPIEIARQIRRNMVKVEDDLYRIEGEQASATARQAAKDLEKLIKAGRSRGEQIAKDIDTLIKSFKSSGGGGGGKSQNKQQQQQDPRSRDRNQNQNQDQQQGRNQKDQGKQQNKPRGGPEDNTREDSPGGRNKDSQKPRRPDPEAARHRNLDAAWGFLPPEIRQRLVDRNFRDFTPEYEQEIKAYFRKINKRK